MRAQYPRLEPTNWCSLSATSVHHRFVRVKDESSAISFLVGAHRYGLDAPIAVLVIQAPFFLAGRLRITELCLPRWRSTAAHTGRLSDQDGLDLDNRLPPPP